MDEKIFEIAFGIIAHAGDAKSTAKEALKEAKKENIEEARNLIKEAEQTLINAHKLQTQLIQKEASGDKTEVSVVLVHSQDHLMTTMNYIQLATDFIDMYEFVLNKVKNI